MSTLHFHQTTTSTPEQFLAALIDFGPGRSKIFGDSADDYLKVHHRGSSRRRTSPRARAESGNDFVTTGPDRNRVVMKTTDSNIWGGKSGHIYTFTRRPDGKTDIDAVVIRDGKNLKGYALGLVLGTVGRSVLRTAFEKTVKAIEARNRESVEGAMPMPARRTS